MIGIKQGILVTVSILILLSHQIFAAEINLPALFTNQGYIAVPINVSKEQNVFYINLSFGNGKKQAFLLDTGALSMSIDKEKFVPSLMISDQSIKNINWGDGSAVQAKKVTITKLILGGHPFYNEIAYVLSLPAFVKAEVEDDQHTIGLLGLNFLRKYSAVIDIPNKQLYLKINSNNIAAKKIIDGEMLTKMGYQVIPFKYFPHGNIMLQVKINDVKSANFVLDTGSNNTLLASNFVNSQHMKIKENTEYGYQSDNALQLKVFEVEIDHFKVGTVNWSPTRMLAIDMSHMQMGSPLSGIVGTDWVQENEAIIDMEYHAIYVKSR